MGMKSRLIPDSRVSASSSFRTWSLESFTWRPQFARLDKQGKTNAWTAQVQDRNQWIQVSHTGVVLSEVSETLRVKLVEKAPDRSTHSEVHTAEKNNPFVIYRPRRNLRGNRFDCERFRPTSLRHRMNASRFLFFI